jgi:hypothetical protein
VFILGLHEGQIPPLFTRFLGIDILKINAVDRKRDLLMLMFQLRDSPIPSKLVTLKPTDLSPVNFRMLYHITAYPLLSPRRKILAKALP